MKARHIPLLLSALAAGCAAPGVDTRGEAGSPPRTYTPIPTESRWTVPAELPAGEPAIVALVDLDFSKRDTEIVVTPASFRPDGNTVRLAVFEEGRRVRTIAALRDALAERMAEPPVGLVVTANGEALGAGARITPAMQQFLAYFVDQLDKAGVAFTILAPERLSVVRSSDRSEAAAEAGDPEPEEKSPAPSPGPAPSRRAARYSR